MNYVYRSGCNIPGVSASEAAEELDRIRGLGDLTAEAVVREARDEQSLLHPAFEWDDAKAAHQHRLDQARSLIKGICVVYDESEPVPMHFHISTEDRPRYERFDNVAKDSDLFSAALEELKGKVKSAQCAVDQLMAIGSGKLKGKKRKTAQAVSQHLKAADEALAVLS